MEFLASLAIKALIGTSVCGAITVGTIYKCDRTLLGFAPSATNTDTSGKGKSGRVEGVLLTTETTLGTLGDSENQLSNTPSNPKAVVVMKENSDSSGESDLTTDTSLNHNNEEEEHDDAKKVIDGVVKPDENSGEDVNVNSTGGATSKNQSGSVEKSAAKVIPVPIGQTESKSTGSEEKQQTNENGVNAEISSATTHS